MKKLILTISAFLLLFTSYSKELVFNLAEFTVNIEPTEISPDIDGVINSEEWIKAYTFNNFWDHWPSDESLSEFQTEVKLTYDDDYLYLAIRLEDNSSDKIIQSLKRDSEEGFWSSDGFAVIIDPINSKSNGYIFGVNAGGAQFDGLVSVKGGYNSIDANWDNIWDSNISINDDHWEIEIAIPFSSLKYNKNTEWGINFIRNDMKRNLNSTWTKFPMNFQQFDLGYTGNVSFKSLPNVNAKKYVIVPSTVGSIERNNADGIPTTPSGNLGLDSKIAISSALNLDLTVNPDFSQVEVDQQVTNLSRFNPFFPEKRNFFLENSDLFSNLGSYESRPIFTRKIGIKDGENVPIIAGARLSGNITENMRVGFMDIQTASKGDIDAENYAIASIQQNVLKRSSIKSFLVNRETINNTDVASSRYNRVGGIEFNYLSEDGKLQGSAIYHQSFSPEKHSSSGFYSVGGSYNAHRTYSNIHVYQMDKNYIADVGFTPRLNNYDAEKDTSIRLAYKQIFARQNFKFFPKSGKVNRHQIGGLTELFYNAQNELTEYSINIDYFLRFKNRSWFYARFSNSMVKLPYPTLIISSDNPLPASRYKYNTFFARYKTNPGKKLSGNLFGGYGTFYSGTKLSIGSSLNFRAQPWGNFSINYQLNKVDLGQKYGEQSLHLLGAKTEISFSRKLFWTTFLQYNTQAENFNINSRIQWRYKPMSDIYFVVTNNYFTTDFSQKDLMFVLKLSYWLNI